MLLAASALLLSSAYEASIFSQFNPITPYFFHLKYFLWKGPLKVRVRKKIINHILGYNSFCFEIRAHLGNIFYLLTSRTEKNSLVIHWFYLT